MFNFKGMAESYLGLRMNVEEAATCLEHNWMAVVKTLSEQITNKRERSNKVLPGRPVTTVVHNLLWLASSTLRRTLRTPIRPSFPPYFGRVW